MTKCEFHKFGSSGTVQKFDALCVLPLNIINEKIYVFLWFWFVIVSIITGIQVRGGAASRNPSPHQPPPPPPKKIICVLYIYKKNYEGGSSKIFTIMLGPLLRQVKKVQPIS
jgi:hypothetical protein